MKKMIFSHLLLALLCVFLTAQATARPELKKLPSGMSNTLGFIHSNCYPLVKTGETKGNCQKALQTTRKEVEAWQAMYNTDGTFKKEYELRELEEETPKGK
jgi:hypothetical protein